MIDELYGSRCSCCDGGVSDSSVSVGVGIDDDLLDEILQEIYNEEVDEVSGISPTLFSANRDYFHKAIDDGIINSANAKIDDDQEWIDALKHSADVFSLHRTANQCALLAESMVDSDGNLKSFEQFKKDTQSINKHYNQAWLRTEYDTAVLRAQMGADWKLFERDADVLPNLRWMQTTSANPREAHAVFWRNKLTLPIDDPFWNKHRPGDQWNCKCWLEQTDEDATKKEDMPPSSDMPEPKAGLKGNPAKTKEIFSQDHPHFPDKCANCHLNSDGKVHGVKKPQNINDVSRREAKGNCSICDVAKTCQERIERLSDPNANPKLIPVKGYEGKIFVHENADMNDMAQNLEEAKHIIDAGFHHIKHIVINHHIIENDLPNQEYTFIYQNGTKMYGDRKGVQGESGIATSFSTAINDQCDKVLVIEYNTQRSKVKYRLNIEKMANKLIGRLKNFEDDDIHECYIIRDGNVVRFDKDFMLSDEKFEIRKKIIKMLEPIRSKKEG